MAAQVLLAGVVALLDLQAASPCGANRNTSAEVHSYLGRGQWSTDPVGKLLRKLGRDVICDHAADTPGTWHSQNGQDKRVYRSLDDMKHGFFADLASNKPVTFSNTRTLERDHGWRGLCIDGHVGMIAELATRRTCKVIEAIVSHTADEPVTFRRFHGNWKSSELHAMSGIVAKGMANGLNNKTCWGKGAGGGTGWPCVSLSNTRGAVQDNGVTATLEAILDRFGAPPTIDYLSLDVEGAEEAVLVRFPFARYRFRIMSIERPSHKLAKVLEGNGYRYLCDNGQYGDQLWMNHLTFEKEAPESLRERFRNKGGNIKKPSACS